MTISKNVHMVHCNRAKILKALSELGPMNKVQIVEEVGIPEQSVRAILSRMNRKTPRREKQIHISDWLRSEEAEEKFYLRAVYSVGNKPDKIKPKRLTNAECVKRYVKAKVDRIRSISPFHAGMKVKDCLNF